MHGCSYTMKARKPITPNLGLDSSACQAIHSQTGLNFSFLIIISLTQTFTANIVLRQLILKLLANPNILIHFEDNHNIDNNHKVNQQTFL